MDKSLLAKLRRDSIFAGLRISEIAQNQSTNFQIHKPDYVTPTFYDNQKPLPMNHTLGLFVYFERIHETIRKAMREGEISIDELPIGAPDYLEKLVISNK